MHRSELDQGTQCADCGARILAGAEDDFDLGESGTLCATCATQRGGSYDAHQERWVRAPSVADLVGKPS